MYSIFVDLSQDDLGFSNETFKVPLEDIYWLEQKSGDIPVLLQQVVVQVTLRHLSSGYHCQYEATTT